MMEEVGQTSSDSEVSTVELTRAIGRIRGEGRSLNVAMALQQIGRLTIGLQESGLTSVQVARPHDRVSNDPLDDCFVKDACSPSQARASEI